MEINVEKLLERLEALERANEQLRAENMYKEGVSLTNNAAERALRRTVIIRKTSYGTESQAGDKFVSIMRTMTETLRRHGKSTFAFIQSSILAHILDSDPLALLS